MIALIVKSTGNGIFLVYINDNQICIEYVYF